MGDAVITVFCRPVTRDDRGQLCGESLALEQLGSDSAVVPIEQVVDGSLALAGLPEDAPHVRWR
ncbi:MAG: hypothetical protein ACFCGT_25355 [Sandaracinaceae bacterium]